MDIWNNKTRLQTKIKRFTLKATASAVIALNAEALLAGNCPTEIYGTALAGLTCDFISGNSVTVENGGTVGSIQMSAYQPTDSTIAVNTGGLVSNTTGIGIAFLNSSSLSNGLSNNGTISAQSGIGISANSIINGGISNTGLISADTVGIALSNSTVSDGITNSGTINSSTGVGISLLNSSTLNGDLSNSGVISTHATAIYIANNGIINGSISNSGTIDSTHATGIRIGNTSINGSIFNSGTISGGLADSGITLTANTTLSGDITNQGLIHAIGGNALDVNLSVLNGGISNNGSIISTGVDGIHISDLSTIHGNIRNDGTLSGGQNGLSMLSGSTAGGIENSGSINAGNNGLNISSSTINGSITNTGTIHAGSTGISIANTASVTGGISNSGTIQGDVFAINTGNSSVSSIDILGQKARIIGAVEATSSNVNITDGALFTSEGSYNVNTFNVAQNAFFTMANTITATAGVNNSGTLAITNGLQTIAGDYTQNTGGIFQASVSSTANYGQLSVSGGADLSQSGSINIQVTQNASLHAGDVLTDIINGATLTQPINGFDITDNSVIWKFIPGVNNLNTGVNLTLAIDPAAYGACQGHYCQDAADYIIGQVASGNTLFSPYGALSTASALQTAASQATPELTNENIQIVQLITRAVVDIAPMWSSLRGKSSGDAMLYQPGKIWLKPYGASMTQNERSTVNGFDAAAYGAVLGKDIELSDDVVVGGAFAAGGDSIQGKSVLSGQSIQSNAYQGMVYGSKKLPKQIYVAGQGLVGYENNSTSRYIPLYASKAKGSYNSWFTNIRAEAGWSTSPFGSNFVITPEIDASYLFINQGSYQESGSPMDLSVASNNNSSLVLGAYANGAYQVKRLKDQGDLTLTAYAGVAGDVINSQPQVTSTFVNSGSGFSTFGVQFNGAVFRGGAGVLFSSPNKPVSLELNYDLQVGNNAYSGVGAATVKYKR